MALSVGRNIYSAKLAFFPVYLLTQMFDLNFSDEPGDCQVCVHRHHLKAPLS